MHVCFPALITVTLRLAATFLPLAPASHAQTLSGNVSNLATDIHEDRDLAATNPAKAQELQSLWDEWNKANVKPLWGAGAGAGDNDGPEPGAV